MACVNTWRCDLTDCCNGYSFEQVPLNFLCDVNIDNYVNPDLGLDMTILWSGDPLVWSGYSALTIGVYSGCFRITDAVQGNWVEGAFTPDPSAWFSGQTLGRNSCNSCITLYPCPQPNPCITTSCYKCRYENATSVDQCVPYIYSGCVELRDAQTHWEGRKMYDVSGWFQGGLSQTWRAIPTFYPAWPKNVSWSGFNPLPCPSNNGVQYSNEVWYDFGDDVPFGQELPIDPTDFPFSPNWEVPCYGTALSNGMNYSPYTDSKGSVLETWWHIGTHTGNIDMTFDVPDGKYEYPMRIIVYWNDIMFCDSGFIGNITARRNGTQSRITSYWNELDGVWRQYNVGCGYQQDIYEMAPGKFGTCGRNVLARQVPYYNTTLGFGLIVDGRPCSANSNQCYSFTPPSYSSSNPGNYALRSHQRRDFWGDVTFADGRTFPQYGAPGQIGVVNDYPSGSARSTNGRIKLRFNKNLPEPTYCKIFVLRGPKYFPERAEQRIIFKEMICNGLS